MTKGLNKGKLTNGRQYNTSNGIFDDDVALDLLIQY